jgi:hypothetical protein
MKAMRGRIIQVVRILRRAKSEREKAHLRKSTPAATGRKRRIASLKMGFIFA